MSANLARLVIQSVSIGGGPNPGQIISLGTVALSLGRDATNDVVLNDPEISRRHARVLPQGSAGDGFLLEDLNSANGTYVNGGQVTGRVLLESGDVIQLAESVRIVFEMPASAVTVMSARPTLDHDTPVDLPRANRAGTLPSRPPELALWEPGKSYDAPPSRYKAMPVEFEGLPATATRYEPPPPALEPAPPAAKRGRPRWLTCVVILFLLLFACTATVFWLDAYHPDRLYGPLEPLFRLLGLMN